MYYLWIYKVCCEQIESQKVKILGFKLHTAYNGQISKMLPLAVYLCVFNARFFTSTYGDNCDKKPNKLGHVWTSKLDSFGSYKTNQKQLLWLLPQRQHNMNNKVSLTPQKILIMYSCCKANVPIVDTEQNNI